MVGTWRWVAGREAPRGPPAHCTRSGAPLCQPPSCLPPPPPRHCARQAVVCSCAGWSSDRALRGGSVVREGGRGGLAGAGAGGCRGRWPCSFVTRRRPLRNWRSHGGVASRRARRKIIFPSPSLLRVLVVAGRGGGRVVWVGAACVCFLWPLFLPRTPPSPPPFLFCWWSLCLSPARRLSARWALRGLGREAGVPSEEQYLPRRCSSGIPPSRSPPPSPSEQ